MIIYLGQIKKRGLYNRNKRSLFWLPDGSKGFIFKKHETCEESRSSIKHYIMVNWCLSGIN